MRVYVLALLDGRNNLADILAILDDSGTDLEILQGDLVSDRHVIAAGQLKIRVIMGDHTGHLCASRQVLHNNDANIVLVVVNQQLRDTQGCLRNSQGILAFSAKSYILYKIQNTSLVNRIGLNRTRQDVDQSLQETDTNIGFKPLYAQVKDQLIRRLVDGTWQPGMNIPSEQELARQLSVSQGTVRKALDAMTAENLLVRRQGRGTFVAEPEDARILFQFFRLTDDNGTGEDAFPQSRLLSCTTEPATEQEAVALSISPGSEVWRIERVRQIRGQSIIAESITIPAATYPGFADLSEIPNNIYRLYSTRWGITIAKADEQLKAILCNERDAAALGCAVGEPLLLITRIARDLEGNPVELRTSRCLTTDTHYAVNLP